MIERLSFKGPSRSDSQKGAARAQDFDAVFERFFDLIARFGHAAHRVPAFETKARITRIEPAKSRAHQG
jgi:hypothetical protein